MERRATYIYTVGLLFAVGTRGGRLAWACSTHTAVARRLVRRLASSGDGAGPSIHPAGVVYDRPAALATKQADPDSSSPAWGPREGTYIIVHQNRASLLQSEDCPRVPHQLRPY